MIRFSAQGAYLLLVPQRRTLIRDRALISILKNNQIFIGRRALNRIITVITSKRSDKFRHWCGPH